MKPFRFLVAAAFALTMAASTIVAPAMADDVVHADAALTSSAPSMTVAPLRDQSSCAIRVYPGTWTGTLSVSGTNDPTQTFTALPITPYPSGSSVSSVTTAGLYIIPVASLSAIQISAASVTGTIGVRATCGAGLSSLGSSSVTFPATQNVAPAPSASPFPVMSNAYSTCLITTSTLTQCATGAGHLVDIVTASATAETVTLTCADASGSIASATWPFAAFGANQMYPFTAPGDPFTTGLACQASGSPTGSFRIHYRQP